MPSVCKAEALEASKRGAMSTTTTMVAEAAPAAVDRGLASSTSTLGPRRQRSSSSSTPSRWFVPVVAAFLGQRCLPAEGGSEEAQVCEALGHLGLYRQLQADLLRYSEALGPEEASMYRNFCALRKRACVTLRVVDGVPYVLDLFEGYQTRMRSTLHLIYRALQRLGPVPNCQVVIDVTDGELQNVDLPILVITHRLSRPAGILYPDFTFYAWPESACPPDEPSHAYSYMYHRFLRETHRDVLPWRHRRKKLFWRGARVTDGGLRENALSELSRAPSDVVDAKFMTWRATSPVGGNEAQGCVGLLEQCKHQYLAFLPGTTYSSRLKFQLLCGSCVLAAKPEFIEWWTHLLEPGVHFAEVLENWSNARDRLEQLLADDTRSAIIAAQGQELAMTLLSPSAVDCYWWQLLRASAEVLPQPDFAAPLPGHARPLEDVLLWPEGVMLSAEIGGPAGIAPSAVQPPRELHDPSCFGEGSGRHWSYCCNAERFGPDGNRTCWDNVEGRTFDRCCLGAGASPR